MKKWYKNKIFSYFLVVGLLLSFVFGCAMSMQNILHSTVGHDTVMTDCCYLNTQQMGSMDMHNIPFVLISNNVWQVLLLLGIASYLVFKDKWQTNDELANYWQLIRDRYGGFKIFNKFVYLLAQGIIHPKIF